MGGLKKPASDVLASSSCSRTHVYVPRAKEAAAFPSRGLRTGLDSLFEHSLMSSLATLHDIAIIETSEKSEYSIVQ